MTDTTMATQYIINRKDIIKEDGTIAEVVGGGVMTITPLPSAEEAHAYAKEMLKFVPEIDRANPSKWQYGIAELKYGEHQEGQEVRQKVDAECLKALAGLKNQLVRKPDTKIFGGDSKCRHRFKIWGTNLRIFSLLCEKCQAHTERATTPKEKQQIAAREKRFAAESAELHAISHAFQRKFTRTGKFEIKGWKLIKSIERFAKKYPQIKQVGVDDDYNAGSGLFLIPHETKSEYWGTSVVYVPQCTGEEAIRFFLYPGHLNKLTEELQKIQKRTISKNKHKGRKGDDY